MNVKTHVPAADAARIEHEKARHLRWAQQLAECEVPLGAGNELLEAAAIGLGLGPGALNASRDAFRNRPPKVRLYERERPDCEACEGSGMVEVQPGFYAQCGHGESPAT